MRAIHSGSFTGEAVGSIPCTFISPGPTQPLIYAAYTRALQGRATGFGRAMVFFLMYSTRACRVLGHTIWAVKLLGLEWRMDGVPSHGWVMKDCGVVIWTVLEDLFCLVAYIPF